MALKDWPTEDKPREKLVLNGSTYLTNAELLSILLGSGSRENTGFARIPRPAESRTLCPRATFTQ